MPPPGADDAAEAEAAVRARVEQVHARVVLSLFSGFV
jgi:hypothetical protein